MSTLNGACTIDTYIEKLAAFVYHLASTWVQLPSISTCCRSADYLNIQCKDPIARQVSFISLLCLMF